MFVTPGGGGATRYAAELVPALRSVADDLELTAFVSTDAPEGLVADPRSEGVEWVRLPVGVAHRTHLLAQVAALPALVRRRRLDVLHSPANIGPLVTPGAARVVTLLDVIWLHQGEQWDQGRAARAFGFLTKACARNAHRLLAISAAARDDIAKSLRLPRDKIDVSPLGVRLDATGPGTEEQAVRRDLELGDAAVILCVAQKRPYKNLGTLIQAIADLRDERPVLVLPGSPTPYEGELRALAQRLGVVDRVRFPPWVSDETLAGLYRTATCFVLPSLIEGFGLPVLEAMARGVPVACSNRPALPEVAGDAALMFDPERQGAVTEAVGRLLRDSAVRQQLVQRGRERARLFTWERTAQATLACYQTAVETKKSRSRV
jgi:glycosyltransferase involved in cell wall biosynthesis